MDLRTRLIRNVFRSINVTVPWYRSQLRWPSLLYFRHPKSSMVEKKESREDIQVSTAKKAAAEIEIRGPMRHLLKGQKKTAQIKRVSFFRGEVQQEVDKYHIIAFENAMAEEKSKEGFIRVVHDYINSDRLQRRHLSFVYTALNYIDIFGLEKDLDTYNEILEVLPKYKIVNKTILDAWWPKPYPQIDAALDLLTKMEDNGIRPDDLTYTILMEVFGRASFPVQKAQRMAYWFDKYKHANPHLLSEEDLKDRYKVCQFALKRISMDDGNMKVYHCEDAEEDAYGKSFLIGHQNQEQRDFLANHKASKTLYVEGPYDIWMNHVKEQYFILRSKALHIENPLSHEDDTRIREGMVLGICMTNRAVTDALHSWLQYLQKDNPRLAEFSIIFNVTTPNEVSCN